MPAHSGPAITSSTKLFISVSCLMCCVYSHARMASSTSLCLVLPSPLSFMNLQFGCFHPMLASYYPLPVSAFIGVAACHPFRSAHSSCRLLSEVPSQHWEHGWSPITLVLRLHLAEVVCPSLPFHNGTVLMRSVNSTFSFPF